MCYDPWEHGIYDYANRYIEAVWESQRQDRDEKHRHVWAGKAEGFEKAYPDKLAELDYEELNDWLEDAESDWTGENKERLLIPAQKELKNRTNE